MMMSELTAVHTNQAQEQAQPTDLNDLDTIEFLGRAIAAASEAVSVGPGSEWNSFIVHIEAWAKARAAQPQAASVPALPEDLDIAEQIALSSIDSYEFAELMGSHAAAPSMDTAWAVLRYADKRMHEIIARRFELATPPAPTAQPLTDAFQFVSKKDGTELWLQFDGGSVCLNNIANDRGPITRRKFCAAIERHLAGDTPAGEKA